MRLILSMLAAMLATSVLAGCVSLSSSSPAPPSQTTVVVPQ
jgi:outer membrane murein-binding lipoprotein Lpp